MEVTIDIVDGSTLGDNLLSAQLLKITKNTFTSCSNEVGSITPLV